MYKNHEGYPSPTEGEAICKADRIPKPVKDIKNMLKAAVSVTGFEIIEIKLKDRRTGRIW